MCNSFWNDFLANFLSDLLAGAVLGTLLGLWVGKRLGAFERSQQRKDEKRAEHEKAIGYLELLKDEIKHLISTLPGLINAFQETGWGVEIRMPTPFWDILQPSGELPRLLDPHLLASLTLFYDHLMYAKRGRDWVIDSWVGSDPTKGHPGDKEKLDGMTLLALKRALQFGRGLPGKLGSEIQRLKEGLEII